MTLEDLVKKIAGRGNGIYGVLRKWINDYKKLCEQIRERDISPATFNRLLAERRYAYEVLSGFIWGLFAADYITYGERSNLTEELKSIQKGVKSDISQKEI